MHNILLVSKDIEYCKNLLRHISKKDNLKVTAIANNIEEIKYSLANCNVDIIIMVLNISEYNYIKKAKIFSINKYSKSILLILDDTINSYPNEDIVYDCIDKSENIKKNFELNSTNDNF